MIRRLLKDGKNFMLFYQRTHLVVLASILMPQRRCSTGKVQRPATKGRLIPITLDILLHPMVELHMRVAQYFSLLTTLLEKAIAPFYVIRLLRNKHAQQLNLSVTTYVHSLRYLRENLGSTRGVNIIVCNPHLEPTRTPARDKSYRIFGMGCGGWY